MKMPSDEGINLLEDVLIILPGYFSLGYLVRKVAFFFSIS